MTPTSIIPAAGWRAAFYHPTGRLVLKPLAFWGLAKGYTAGFVTEDIGLEAANLLSRFLGYVHPTADEDRLTGLRLVAKERARAEREKSAQRSFPPDFIDVDGVAS